MSSENEQIRRGFEEAYREAGDVSVETDIDAQQRSRRQRELDTWNLDKARATAAEEGIELNNAHLQVIHCLRNHYLEHGLAEHGRELGDMLDERFANAGGRKYLRRLFPEGPVAQGLKLAGLPVPGDTEDAGFGTAR